MKKTLVCHCGENHEIDLEIPRWKAFDDMVTKTGDIALIQHAGTKKTYRVPKIFIAIHGLRGKDLPNLGFEEKEKSANID